MGRRQGVGGATKSVAVKFIIPSKTNSERHREMFLTEARLSMMLSHSNVIQVFDAGEDDGRLYMVMEWIDGMNLSQLLAQMRAEGKLPSLSLGGYVIGEVLKGLAYAHNLYHEGRQITVVHRDISPQNVIVSVSGEVKVLDFGVARLAQEETSGIHIKGKLRYMAPEHLGGSSKAPTVDIYGAGAIFHELLEGKKYRDGADEMQLYNQILGGHTPPLDREGMPPEVAALRAAMLDPDENTRVQTSDLALEQLEAWPGYRSAAGELGRLVRGYMGVNTPRSGIHMQAVSHATVDAMADTAPPTAATNTRQTGATSPEMSTSMPGAGTDPGIPTGIATATSQPFVVPSKKGGSALLLGVGAGLLCAAGAVGVALALKDDKPTSDKTEVALAQEPDEEPDEEPEEGPEERLKGPDDSKAEEPSSLEIGAAPDPGALAADTPEAIPEANPEANPEASGDAPVLPAEPEPEPEPKSPRRNRSKGGKSGTKSGQGSSSAPVAEKPSKPLPSKAKPTMKVSLKLKKPLTVAYVKIDGGSELVLEPMRKVQLSIGKHAIMWRPSRDQPYVQSKPVTLTAGGKSTIRITSSGARLE